MAEKRNVSVFFSVVLFCSLLVRSPAHPDWEEYDACYYYRKIAEERTKRLLAAPRQFGRGARPTPTRTASRAQQAAKPKNKVESRAKKEEEDEEDIDVPPGVYPEDSDYLPTIEEELDEIEGHLSNDDDESLFLQDSTGPNPEESQDGSLFGLNGTSSLHLPTPVSGGRKKLQKIKEQNLGRQSSEKSNKGQQGKKESSGPCLSNYKYEPYYGTLKILYERSPYELFYNLKELLNDKYQTEKRKIDEHYYNELDVLCKLFTRDKFNADKDSIKDKYKAAGQLTSSQCKNEIMFIFKEFNDDQMNYEKKILELKYQDKKKPYDEEFDTKLKAITEKYEDEKRKFEKKLIDELKNKDHYDDLYNEVHYKVDAEFKESDFDIEDYYNENKGKYEKYKHSEFEEVRKLVEQKYETDGTRYDSNYYSEIHTLCDLFASRRHRKEKKSVNERHLSLGLPLDKPYYDEINFLFEVYTNSRYDNELWLLNLKYTNEGKERDDAYETEMESLYEKYDNIQKDYEKKLEDLKQSKETIEVEDEEEIEEDEEEEDIEVPPGVYPEDSDYYSTVQELDENEEHHSNGNDEDSLFLQDSTGPNPEESQDGSWFGPHGPSSIHLPTPVSGGRKKRQKIKEQNLGRQSSEKSNKGQQGKKEIDESYLGKYQNEPYYGTLKILYERSPYELFYNLKELLNDKYQTEKRKIDEHYYNELDVLCKLFTRDKFNDDKKSIKDKYEAAGQLTNGHCQNEIMFIFKKFNDDQMNYEKKILELKYQDKKKAHDAEFDTKLKAITEKYEDEKRKFEKKLVDELKKRNHVDELYNEVHYKVDAEFMKRDFDIADYYTGNKEKYEKYKHTEFEEVRKLVEQKYQTVGKRYDSNYYSEIHTLCELFAGRRHRNEKKYVNDRHLTLGLPLDKHYYDELKFLFEVYTSSRYDNEMWLLNLKYTNEGKKRDDAYETEMESIYAKHDKKQKYYEKKLQDLMKKRKTTEEEVKGKIGSAKAKGILGKLFATGSPIGSFTPTSRECPSVTINGDIYMDADEKLSTFKKEPYYDELKELYERYKHQSFYNVKRFIDDKYDLQQRDYDTHYYNEIDFMIKLMIRDKFLDEKNSILDKYRSGDHNDGRCYREIVYLFKKYNEEQMMTEQRVLELRYLNEYRMRGPDYFQELLIKQHNYNNKCKIFERELEKELKNPLQRKKNDKSELFDGLYYHDDEEFSDRTFDKASYYDEMKKLYEHYKHSEFEDIKKIVDKKYANLGTSANQNYYTEINRLCDILLTKKYEEEKKFITERYSYLNMPLDKHYVDELKFLHEQYTNSQYDNEVWLLRLKYQNEGRPTNDRAFERERQPIYKKYDKKQKEYVKKLQEEVGSRRAKGEGEMANKGYSPKLRLSQGKPKDGNYRNESYRLHLMTMYDNCQQEDLHNIIKLVTDNYQAIGRPYDDHFYNEIDVMFKLFKNEKYKHERRNIKEKYGGFGLNRDKCFNEIMFLYQKYNDEKKDAEKQILDLRYKYGGRPQDKAYFTKIMEINGKYAAERKAYKKHLQEELQSSKSDPCDYCGEEYKGIYYDDDDEFNDPNFDLPHYYNEMKIKYEKYRHSEFNDAKNFMDEKYRNEGRPYDDGYYCELNALTYMFLKERFDKEKKFIEDKYTTVDLPRDNKNYYYEVKFLGERFHFLQRTYEHALLDLKYYNDGLPRNENYYLELSDIYKKYDNKHKKFDKALQDGIANKKYNFTEEPDEDDLRNLDYHSKMMSLFKKETRDHDASIQYNMNIKALKENNKLDEFQIVKKLLDDKYTSIGRPFDDHYYNELDYILKSLNLETYHNLKCRIRERYSISGNLGDETSYRHALFTYHLYQQENLNNDKAIINLKYQRRGLPHDDSYHREINALSTRYERESKNYEKKLKAEMETEFNEREYFAEFYEAPNYKNDEEFGHSGFDFYLYYSEAKFAFQKYEHSEFDEVKKIVDKRFIDEGRLFDDSYYSELKRLADVCTTEKYKEETKNITEKYKKLGQTQVSEYYHRELMDAFSWYNHKLSLTEMWITHLKYQNEGKSRDESFHSLMQIIGDKYEEKRLRYAGKLGIHFTRYKGRDYNYNQDDVNPDAENHSEYYNKLQRMLAKYSNEEFDKIKKDIDEKYKLEARPFDKHYYSELERVSYGKCNDKYNDEVEKIHLRYQREVRPRDKHYYNELMSAFAKNSEEKFNLGKVILDLKYKNQGRPFDESYRNSVKKLYEKLVADNGQQQNKLDAELNGRTATNDFHSAQYKGPVDFVDDDMTEEDKKNEQYYNKLKEIREKCNKNQFDTVKKIVDKSKDAKEGDDEDYYNELRRVGADKINEQYKKEKKAIKDKYKGQKGLPRDDDYYYQLMRLFEKYNDEHLNHEKLVLELRHKNENLPQDERFHALLKHFYEKCVYDKQAYQEKFLDKIRKNKAPSGKYDDGDNDDAQDFSTHRSSPQSLTDGEYKKKLNRLLKSYDPTEFHNLKQTLDGEYQSSGKSIDADYFKELKTRATKNVKDRHDEAKNTIIRIYKQIPGGRRCDEFYKELIELFYKYNDEKFNNEKYILELKYERERLPRREEYHKQVRSIFENIQSEKDKYELKMLEELIKKKNKARSKQQQEGDDDEEEGGEGEGEGAIEVTYDDEDEDEESEKTESKEQQLKKQQYDEEVKALNKTFEVEEKRHQESYANELKGLFDKYNKNIKSLLEIHDKENPNKNYVKEKKDLDVKYKKGTKDAALGDDYYGEFKALFDKYPTVNYNREMKALDDKCATEKAAHDSHYTEKNKVLTEKYNTQLKILCEKYDQQFPGYTKSAKGPLGTQGGKSKTKKAAAPNQRKPLR